MNIKYSSYESPSEKSFTIQTEDSKPTPIKVYYLPNSPNSQKRFQRKNNSSLEKKVNRSTSNNESVGSLHNFSRKNSEKPVFQQPPKTISPSYIKLDSFLKGGKGVFESKSSSTLKLNKSFRDNFSRESSFCETSSKISQEKNEKEKYSEKLGEKLMGNISVLETELELKEKEIVKLQEERRKFRNQYEEGKRKQAKLRQEFNAYKKEAIDLKRKQEISIRRLEEDLKKERKYVEDGKVRQKHLSEELRVSERQKQNVVKQLNMYVQRKVPKNIKDLQSWKQISLNQQISQLKQEMNRSKSDIQIQQENVIKRLQEEVSSLRQEQKRFQIANRLLLQKSQGSEKYFQAYTALRSEYQSTKAKAKELKEECEHLKKENFRLKKEGMGNRNRKQAKQLHRSHLRLPSESESLTLSINSKD